MFGQQGHMAAVPNPACPATGVFTHESWAHQQMTHPSVSTDFYIFIMVIYETKRCGAGRELTALTYIN